MNDVMGGRGGGKNGSKVSGVNANGSFCHAFKVFFGMQSILTILIFVSRQLLCHDICSILKTLEKCI